MSSSGLRGARAASEEFFRDGGHQTVASHRSLFSDFTESVSIILQGRGIGRSLQRGKGIIPDQPDRRGDGTGDATWPNSHHFFSAILREHAGQIAFLKSQRRDGTPWRAFRDGLRDVACGASVSSAAASRAAPVSVNRGSPPRFNPVRVGGYGHKPRVDRTRDPGLNIVSLRELSGSSKAAAVCAILIAHRAARIDASSNRREEVQGKRVALMAAGGKISKPPILRSDCALRTIAQEEPSLLGRLIHRPRKLR